jgi:predicted P-loop ATPase
MAVGQAMLIAAVARIYEPGCKVDTVPILEGAQGARKSTAVKAMFDPWFTDELADLGSKDACLQTQGVWGVEVSELDAMTRGEVSRIKAFISRTTDRFRPPYGHRVIETARECVFWGTTNSDSYLKDETGGRRFWPIKVGKIDIDGLIGVRDMLWAEAKALYEKNTPWWLAKDDVLKQAEDQQRGRYIGDPWERHISDYVESSFDGEVSVDVILRNALELPISHCGQIEMNRVARVLRSLGLVRTQVRIGGDKTGDTGGKRVWVYRKPVTSPVERPGDRPGTSSKPVTPGQPVTPEGPAARAQSQQSPQSPVEEEFI